MSSSSVSTVVLVAIVVSASAAFAQESPASADDEVARNLFQAGKTAYEAGNYEDALRYFEDAHARSHRPQLLYNIGQAADRLREDEKALTSFKAYLAALPDADNRSEVENRIRALERRQRTGEVPTPRETAQASNPTQSAAPLNAASDDQAVTGKWWFWTAIGGGVAVVLIAVIAASSGDTTQGPVDGNTGVTVMTLGGAP